MPREFTSENINELLDRTRAMSDDGDVQLSILARAFITACQSCAVDRKTADRVLDDMWALPVTLVPIPHLNN